MLAPAPPADVVYNLTTVIAPVLALIIGALGSVLTRRWRERRKGSQGVKTDVRQLKEAWLGRKPSIFEPHPPPGMRDQMSSMKTTLNEHGVMLDGLQTSVAALVTKTTPNGGNTREIGDMILLIAERLGIDVPEREADDA